MKWLALGFALVGIAAIVAGFKLDKISSFDDGSFINELVLFIAGGVCVLIGVAMFAVLAFANL